MWIARECIEAVRLLGDGSARSVATRLGWTAALSVAGGALASLAPLALKELVDLLHAAVGPVAALAAASGIPDPIASTTPADPAGSTISVLGIAALVAAYLGCHCAARVLAELRPLLMSAAEQDLYGRLRVRYFGHLLALPIEVHLSRRAGATLQELQQANAGYQILLFHGVNSIVPVVVEAMGVMLVLLSLRQPGLTATLAMTTLAYVLVMTWGIADLRMAATTVTQRSSDVQAMLAEGLSHVEPIKVFGAERPTIDRFSDASLALQRAWARLQWLRLHRGLTLAAVFTVSITVSLVLSTRAVLDGSLTVGGFVIVNLYVMQVVRPLEALSGAVRDVGQALAFVRPLLDLMTLPRDLPHSHVHAGSPAKQDPTAPGDAGRSLNTPCQPVSASHAPGIVFRGVHLAFEGRHSVLRGLDLDIAAGRSTAIVGASGSGKSSLVRLLLRLQEPQAGAVLIDGVPVQAMPVDRLRAMVAAVPQEVMLFHATLARNIAFGVSQATRSAIERAAGLAGLQDLIDALPHGYDTMIGERGHKLSGGERQRVAIARAILRDPLIYVFDEATSMLDAATEAEVLRNVRAISTGRTTITIAHRLSAIQHADHIAVLSDGRVAEQGTHAQLLERRGVYAALWQAQEVSAEVSAEVSGEVSGAAAQARPTNPVRP